MKDKLLKVVPKRLYLEFLHLHFKLTKQDSYKHFQNQRKVLTDEGYSLKPFDDTKSIFVHIPKCAGVSINRTLYGNLAGGHATFNMYLSIFEPKVVNSYFKFTIVRNPWDRLVSAYHFFKKGGMNDADKKWSEEELSGLDSFDEFVKSWLNSKNIWKYHHFRPQCHYMLDNRNKVFVDFVGFLENIENDFNTITKYLSMDKKLLKSNKSDHASYMKYYNDETVEIVSNVYSDDIQMLGYSFDNSSLNRQIEVRNTGHRYSI